MEEQNNPYDELETKYQIAIDMRLENVPAKYIAQKLKVTVGYVYALFTKGGKLYDAWKFEEKRRHKEYKKYFNSIDNQIRDAAVEAVNLLREAIKRNDMKGVIAAKDILDRAGFKPTDKFEDLTKTPTKVEVTIVKKYNNDESATDTQIQD